MRKNGLFLFNYRFINTVLKVPVGEGVYTNVFGGNVTDDDEEDVTNGEVAAVGEGVKKNEFGLKVNDDGEGDDVTKGEGVNENVLGDGEADIGDEDGDDNEGDFFFRLLFKGITFPSLSELCMSAFSCFYIAELVCPVFQFSIHTALLPSSV